MCGIVGAVSSVPTEAKILEAMRDRLVHRGPDHGGLWTSADARICLGTRRLAIIDLDPEANQPFVSHDGRFVITFNGEIYNFQELRKELQSGGILCQTQSDTEVLVESFRRWGNRCLARLSGMFAFAVWDTIERRLFCARDRAGEKPFYYALVGESFLFASEVKALLQWPGFHKRIDYSAISDYLCFGFVPDPKCIWEGCHKLDPGHWMSVELTPGSELRVSEPVRYWDMTFATDTGVDDADWSTYVLETLQSATKEMAIADVPLGTFLSGGVDSSSIIAALSRAGHAVRTFTVGFQEREYDERHWAREVAQTYGTTHFEKVVAADDVMPVFRKLLWHYDEPLNDYSYLPTFYLCREARQIVTVALSGDGGDELFAGYLKYQRLGARQQVETLLPSKLRRLLFAGADQLLPTPEWIRGKLRLYHIEVDSLMMDMLMTGFPVPAVYAAARGSLAQSLKNYTPSDTVRSLLRQAPPEEVGLINAMRYLDLKLTLAGDILVKVDRASMAVSLEVRPVYLQRDLMELAGKTPPHLLVDSAQTKKVLKSALRKWLPDSILYRKKHGFGLPLKEWLNGDLHMLFARDNRDSLLEDLLDQDLLMRGTRAHPSKSDDLTLVTHNLGLLKHWLAYWT